MLCICNAQWSHYNCEDFHAQSMIVRFQFSKVDLNMLSSLVWDHESCQSATNFDSNQLIGYKFDSYTYMRIKSQVGYLILLSKNMFVGIGWYSDFNSFNTILFDILHLLICNFPFNLCQCTAWTCLIKVKLHKQNVMGRE